MTMQENKLFPGRPGYTGPTSGVFAMLHHTVLAERSHDVMERVDYVRRCKPKREIKVRLRNMMYLGAAGERYTAKRAPLDADHAAKRDTLWADYEAKLDALEADYEAKRSALWADYNAKRYDLWTGYKAQLDAMRADYKAKRDYKAKLDALWADYKAKRGALSAKYRAKLAPLDAELLRYIETLMPDHAWNGRKIKGTAG